jgi:uncharacterized protein DUF1707
MTEPGTQMAAADRGRLRAGRADREQVIEVLKAAFVQDRLSKEEFDARIGQALAARTYAELSAVAADIPAWLTRVQPARAPARKRARIPMNTAVSGGALVIVLANLGMVAALAAGSALAVILVAVFTVVAATVAVGAMIVAR